MARFISLTDLVYPVNSIYISVNSTSPASMFGGTWTAIYGALRAGSNYNTNFGSDTCTLTTNQIPSHNHACTSTGYMCNIALGAGYTTPVINNYGDKYWPAIGNTGGGISLHRTIQFRCLRLEENRLIFLMSKEVGMSSFISLTDLVYPVGSYFFSNTSSTPASRFGGTWTAVTGRFLYANASTATGGANTHTLTVAEMPSHNHVLTVDGSLQPVPLMKAIQRQVAGVFILPLAESHK